MKIMILGDTHLRYRGPSSRTDDFFETQLGKFREVLLQYNMLGCSVLVQSGDLFDSPRPPNILMSAYIRELRHEKVKIYSVLGQHDISMHSLQSLNRSAFDVMQAANVISLLGQMPEEFEDCDIYGCCFGEDIPVPKESTVPSILVIHRMIGDHDLWPGQNIESPEGFSSKNPGYQLIVCGDYHYRFLADTGERMIVNAGSMVRLSSSERDRALVPGFYVYDTKDRSIEFHEIEYKPSNEVFGVPDDAVSQCSESVLAFVDRLRAEQNVSVSFRDNLMRFFEKEDTDPAVKETILGVLENVS